MHLTASTELLTFPVATNYQLIYGYNAVKAFQELSLQHARFGSTQSTYYQYSYQRVYGQKFSMQKASANFKTLLKILY